MAKKMIKHKNKVPRSFEMTATIAMLHSVRDELRSDIRALDHKMESKFKGVDSRLMSMESKLSNMESSLHQMKLMMEEQNHNNKYVLDGLRLLFDRQERVEGRMDHFEAHFLPLKKDL
jgi:hypothetical protein